MYDMTWSMQNIILFNYVLFNQKKTSPIWDGKFEMLADISDDVLIQTHVALNIAKTAADQQTPDLILSQLWYIILLLIYRKEQLNEYTVKKILGLPSIYLRPLYLVFPRSHLLSKYCCQKNNWCQQPKIGAGFRWTAYFQLFQRYKYMRWRIILFILYLHSSHI